MPRGEKILQNSAKMIEYAKQYGTNVYRIASHKLSKACKSGHTGVFKQKNGKYLAYITFKRQRYYLGTYDNIDDVIKAREAAEDEMYKPVLTAVGLI